MKGNLPLAAENTLAILIDVQQRLLPAMKNEQQVLENTVRLVTGLRLLETEILPLRQYPKGLGDYPEILAQQLDNTVASDKTTFSGWKTEEIRQKIEQSGKKNILLFGIETHICVLQTAIDLLDAGYSVTVICDCCDSRKPLDHEIALRQLMQRGALLSTSESVLFALLGQAGGEVFKAISALIK